MIRRLLIVFASGLVLSILLLSGAWAIGGNELMTHIETDWDDESHGPKVSKTFDFAGDKILTIDGPVSLHFTRGDAAQMIVEGPDSTMKGLRWEDGRLSPHSRHGHWSGGGLDVTITAPQLTGLILRGASDVELDALDQPSLSIDAHGAVDLDANGKVQTLSIKSHGAGDIDLERLAANDASVQVAGVGDVDLSAIGKVVVEISGAGDINLHRKPAELTSKVSGLGSGSHDY